MVVPSSRLSVPLNRNPLSPGRLLPLERICEREKIALGEVLEELRLLGAPYSTTDRGTYLSTRHERKLRRVLNKLVEIRWRAERSETRAGPIEANGDAIAQTYFLTCGEFVKIGFSADVSKRVRDLQTACPYPLTLVALAPGGIMTERRWHVRFREFAHRDEWFRYEGELRDAIEALPTFGLPSPIRSEGA